MDTNTILLIVNLALTLVVGPLIEVIKLFVRKVRISRCCGSELSLDRGDSQLVEERKISLVDPVVIDSKK